MENKNLTINISSSTVIKTMLIFIAFFLLYVLRELVLVVLAAVVIASAIEPGTLFFVRHKLPRILSVIVMYLLIIFIIGSIFYFLLPPLLGETVGVINNLPQYVQTIDLLGPLHATSGVNIDTIFPGLPTSISVADIVKNISGYFAGSSGGFFSTVSNLFGGAIDTILVIVISFYLAVREDGVGEFLKIITPISNEKYVTHLWKRAQIKIGLWMQGQLLLGVIVGVLIYLGLIILNIKHALLLGVLAACFELIPVVGMTLSGIPAFFLGYIDGGFTLALLVAGLYFIVQQVEAHLIYPLVVKKVIGVPPLLVIISLFAGGILAGFMGIILSVPIAVALMEYFEDLIKIKEAEKNVNI